MSWQEERRATRARLRAHLAQAGAAHVLTIGFSVAAVVALFAKGTAAALAFALLAGVFHLGKPPPDDDLDRRTRR
tara:strand:- start:105 stop:329 length:225 start_codon:yes stop_codon:yes gene_type:complete